MVTCNTIQRKVSEWRFVFLLKMEVKCVRKKPGARNFLIYSQNFSWSSCHGMKFKCHLLFCYISRLFEKIFYRHIHIYVDKFCFVCRVGL